MTDIFKVLYKNGHLGRLGAGSRHSLMAVEFAPWQAGQLATAGAP
jgi:hypothetical protein